MRNLFSFLDAALPEPVPVSSGMGVVMIGIIVIVVIIAGIAICRAVFSNKDEGDDGK